MNWTASVKSSSGKVIKLYISAKCAKSAREKFKKECGKHFSHKTFFIVSRLSKVS